MERSEDKTSSPHQRLPNPRYNQATKNLKMWERYLNYSESILHVVLSWRLSGKEYISWCRTHRFDPWVGKTPWRRKWQPTPGFWPGKPQQWRSLGGYSPWICKGVGYCWATKRQQCILILSWHHKPQMYGIYVEKEKKKQSRWKIKKLIGCWNRGTHYTHTHTHSHTRNPHWMERLWVHMIAQCLQS